MKLLKSNGLFLAGALLTWTCVAAEHTETKTKTTFIRASNIKGAAISFQGGGSAGTIQDIALDPNTGCARFVMIESGGRVVAAPFRVLHESGGGGHSYTISVDRERLMSAPVVNVDRIEEWSDPGFVDRVYSYYGESSSETNVSVNERGHEHGGAEMRNQQREAERGTAEGRRNQQNAQRGQGSPAPVGERANQRNRNNARGAASPNAEASPGVSGSSSQMQEQRSRARGQASPGRSGAGAATSPSAENPAASPTSESQRGGGPAASPRSSKHERQVESAHERGPSNAAKESTSPTSPEERHHRGGPANSPSGENQ